MRYSCASLASMLGYLVLVVPPVLVTFPTSGVGTLPLPQYSPLIGTDPLIGEPLCGTLVFPWPVCWVIWYYCCWWYELLPPFGGNTLKHLLCS